MELKKVYLKLLLTLPVSIFFAILIIYDVFNDSNIHAIIVIMIVLYSFCIGQIIDRKYAKR